MAHHPNILPAAPTQRRFSPITLVITVAVLYLAREVLIPLALATLFAFLLVPAVRWLERRRVWRSAATALVATGFGYDAEVRRLQAGVVARLLPRVRDIRRLGSAALDLAWTAAGRYDAYYERGLNAWDVAAGGLLCVSAGLAVRELAPSPPAGAGVLVAPHAIIDELESIVA